VNTYDCAASISEGTGRRNRVFQSSRDCKIGTLAAKARLNSAELLSWLPRLRSLPFPGRDTFGSAQCKQVPPRPTKILELPDTLQSSDFPTGAPLAEHNSKSGVQPAPRLSGRGVEARVAGPPLGVRPEYSSAGRNGACPARRGAGHDDETREDAKSCGAENADWKPSTDDGSRRK
jgi:hypothetical protein